MKIKFDQYENNYGRNNLKSGISRRITDAMPMSFRSELLTPYILKIFKQ